MGLRRGYDPWLCVIGLLLFFGGLLTGPLWQRWLIGFLVWFVLVAITIVLRNTTPRVRIDQMMNFAWKWLMPAALLNIFITAGAIIVVTEYFS